MTREELRNKIEEKFGNRRLKMGTRFLLNIAGGIPFVGGAISGTGAAWAEAEQNEIENMILEWMGNNDKDLEFLLKKYDDLVSAVHPNQVSFVSWIHDIVSDEMAENFLTGRILSLNLILHPTTATEMYKYEQADFIKVDGTSGNQMLMGARNRIGNFTEELKRPHGMGTSYSIYLSRPQ